MIHIFSVGYLCLRIITYSFGQSAPASLLTDYLTITSPSFLRADSQRGAVESTIARRKRGRVV